MVSSNGWSGEKEHTSKGCFSNMGTFVLPFPVRKIINGKSEDLWLGMRQVLVSRNCSHPLMEPCARHPGPSSHLFKC